MGERDGTVGGKEGMPKKAIDASLEFRGCNLGHWESILIIAQKLGLSCIHFNAKKDRMWLVTPS